jgi:uncharacterized protein YqjF (DUF2071 family)
MYQSWNWLTFLHWAYPPDAIQAILPDGLTVDEYDGAAWVGLVPFEVNGLRLPMMRAIPWISSFPETNVRTYVRDDNGDRGVWFLSLDADRLAAVVGARTGFRLPYQWAQMRLDRNGSSIRYSSKRNGLMAVRAAFSEMEIEIGEPFAPEELTDRDHFLTALFRLYTMFSDGLGYVQVEHAPWPLFRARIVTLEEDLLIAAGLPRPEGEPLVHYSTGVDVKVARPVTLVSRTHAD